MKEGPGEFSMKKGARFQYEVFMCKFYCITFSNDKVVSQYHLRAGVDGDAPGVVHGGLLEEPHGNAVVGRAHLRGRDAALPVAAFDVEGGREEIVSDAPELALVRDPLGAGVLAYDGRVPVFKIGCFKAHKGVLGV